MRRPAFLASPGLFPALMGAFGVVMGFAAFVLVHQKTLKADASPGVFLLGLLVAAVTSFAIEAVRERAEGHAQGSAVDPGRVLGLLVLMAIFEVYVSGAEEVVTLLAGGQIRKFVETLFSSGITAKLNLLTQLTLFAGLWVVIGAAAAWIMMPHSAAAHAPGAPLKQELLGSVRKIAGALLLVAGLALTYVLVARLGLTLWVLTQRPEEYAPGFETLLPGPGGSSSTFPAAQAAIMLASGLESVAHSGRLGGYALLAVASVMIGLVVRAYRKRAANGGGIGLLGVILVFTLALLALGPFATSTAQAFSLARIVLATTLIWVAPLVVLAVATPLLRTPSRSPRLWGIVAFVVAVVLLVLTWDRVSKPPIPLLVAAIVVALVVTGWLFWRGADVVKFWPLVALTLAIAAFEGSSLLQQLSFLATFKEAALLQDAPLRGGDEARVNGGFRAVARWAKDSLFDSTTASMVANVDSLPPDTTVIKAYAASVSTRLDGAYLAALTTTCQPVGIAVFDTLHRDVARWCDAVRALTNPSPDSVVQNLWTALFNAPEPWGEGLSSLTDSADQASVSAAFRFEWLDPTRAEQQGMVDRAAAALSEDVRQTAPEVLMARALRDDSTSSTQRLWLVIAALAQTPPPDAAVFHWLGDRERGQLTAAQGAKGVMLSEVIFWGFEQKKRLASLVQAYYVPGIPEVRPASVIRSVRRSITPRERAMHTIVALRFARDQLESRRIAVTSSSALQANAGASILLELSLGASFAFWATAGLLAGLARREQETSEPTVRTSSST